MRAAAGDRADTFLRAVETTLSASVEKRGSSWPLGAARGARVARLPSEGVGAAFGGCAAARSRLWPPGELRVSGRLFAERAGQPPGAGAAGCNYARSFRGSCWLRIQCWARLHTGCPASGNNGDRIPRRQEKGRRSRMRVKTGRKRGRELFPPLPRLNQEKPGRTPGSHSQTHNPSLRPSGSSFLTLFSFFKAVPAELLDFKKCAWLTYQIALLSLLNLN